MKYFLIIIAFVATHSFAQPTLYDRNKEIMDSVRGKQETLVSGMNVKTINNTSILGNGNVAISGSGVSQQALDDTSVAIRARIETKLAPNGNGGSLIGLAKAQVGLSLADNTSDVSKPVSTLQQAALDFKANLSSPNLVTPNVGAAVGISIIVTGAIKSSGTAGLGYVSTAGGTITQATSKTTGVTINKICGQITMNGAALAAAAEVSFVVTNNTVISTDVVIVNIQSVGTAGAYFVTVGAVGNGSFSITVGNVSAGSLSQAIVLNFAVIKSVSN